MTRKHIFITLLTLALLFSVACESNRNKNNNSQEITPSATPQEEPSATPTEAQNEEEPSATPTEAQNEEEPSETPTEPAETTPGPTISGPTVGFSLPIIGGFYYDVTNVVLYLDLYGELPRNFITKAEARELGWRGGSLENYLEGGAIGGDFYGNYDGLLPKANGRKYYECDIDTDFSFDRGAKRLVFSNDGLYFYTDDHYQSFSQVYVTEDYEVIW